MVRSIIKILSVTLLGLSLLASQLALGHPTNSAPLDNEQAIAKASEITQIIVERPEVVENLTLDTSWKEVTDIRVHNKDLRYFIVSLYNASQKKTLYMLLDSYGKYLGANFDGSFEEL